MMREDNRDNHIVIQTPMHPAAVRFQLHVSHSVFGAVIVEHNNVTILFGYENGQDNRYMKIRKLVADILPMVDEYLQSR